MHGRLAQLVEHSLDVRRVSSSSLLTSTTVRKAGTFVPAFCFARFIPNYTFALKWKRIPPISYCHRRDAVKNGMIIRNLLCFYRFQKDVHKPTKRGQYCGRFCIRLGKLI